MFEMGMQHFALLIHIIAQHFFLCEVSRCALLYVSIIKSGAVLFRTFEQGKFSVWGQSIPTVTESVNTTTDDE